MRISCRGGGAGGVAVAGVSQGAEGGTGEEGEDHVLRDMLRAVLKCDAWLSFHVVYFACGRVIFVYGQRQRNGNERRGCGGGGGGGGLTVAVGHGAWGTGTTARCTGTGAQSRLHFRPRHDAARVNSWKWVFKAPQRMLCRFLASTFVSITVTCYPLRCSYPLPLTPPLRRPHAVTWPRAVATENFADVFLWLKRVHNTTRAAAVRGQCCTTSQHTHSHRHFAALPPR